ncbi:TPA: conjugal transfer transcriptional regulator TraJ [Legionella pneumophila]|uniref:Conjugal transfer transcriptional regulator TraJ n=1 Tax=Legionella pneumophila TaxID=446 RepID=A0AAN5TAG6_LEGPN|nr:conjugal transfer transcriptional regulator TraJ [Legionella pneumophila]HAT9238376.1 conjugal transfer transcriptional regulator TraJ [Legionella pneumophila subsp. pneumophila]MCH9153479.1 conjugal transfer transcriptional regulator TraJ [Legionella pneumophila serogroup 1]MCZ4759851.1 conjugal transfer transcriptional regulator TraJ [Legionella pneumophila]MDI9828820.1 conjugal transfer transcriptional regulator TraJ [Legionella pneumophila]MDW8853527.1 conjugal transfer transcriptional 
MDDKNKSPSRKHGRHLRVPVLPDEEISIKCHAAQAGLSVAEYLRRIGLGYQIQSAIDKDYIFQLSKINADMGRLGGLFKLWLTQDRRVAHFDHRKAKALLDRIQATQDVMFEVVKKL